MRLFLLGLIITASGWLLPLPGQAAQPVELVMFYGQGCPHCSLMESHLLQLQAQYPTLRVTEYEVYQERENIALFQQYAAAYGVEIAGVPMLFIGREVIVGNRPDMVDDEVANCLQNGCPYPAAIVAGTASLDPQTEPADPSPAPLPPDSNPDSTPSTPPAGYQPTTVPDATTPSESAAMPNTVDTSTEPSPEPAADNTDPQPELIAAPIDPSGKPSGPGPTNKIADPLLPVGLTIPAVISGAVVDAINPCAFAVLILLMTTVLATGNRRRALLAGLAFSGSIFLSYLLMGLGLYSAIQSAGVSRTFYIVIGVLAVLIGLFNLKDYLWYGKWFIMEVPLSWRPRLKALIKGVTSVPGAFSTGILVSLFLLPCTSGPYIVILGMLAGSATRAAAIPMLVLYNAIFVLPMVAITLAVSFGAMNTEKAEAWRQRRLKHLHLIAGVIILTLGVIMLITAAAGH